MSVSNKLVCPALFLSYVDITIFIVGDGDGDNVTSSDHRTAPVVPQGCPKMHLELLFRLKDRIIFDVHCAVFDLIKRKWFLKSAGQQMKKE